MKLTLRDQQNQALREVDLVEEVFGYPLRIPLIHEAVSHFLAKGRSGTASTKTRGEVRGSGRKPWKQKKTGRARVGSVRSPLWRHGGTVFGPRPRDYDFLFPRRKGRNALRSILSQKVREGNLILVDDLSLPEPKTRLLVQILRRMELPGKTLIVDAGENRNLFLAARNHPRFQAVTWGEVNVFNLLAHETVLISEPALGRLTEVFRP
ncbi:MAG: 50S ribosomal protein L4 [Acidobacteria bacterium]|nr:50S ribosomal protein L4 [Acidobacteriota bacterium]